MPVTVYLFVTDHCDDLTPHLFVKSPPCVDYFDQIGRQIPVHIWYTFLPLRSVLKV